MAYLKNEPGSDVVDGVLAESVMSSVNWANNLDHKALRNMDYQRWDEQLEQDVADGKLDDLAAEAIVVRIALRPNYGAAF